MVQEGALEISQYNGQPCVWDGPNNDMMWYKSCLDDTTTLVELHIIFIIYFLNFCILI